MAIVYEHLRNDTNEVFYVGIGKEEGRAYVKDGRNPHWKCIVRKVGYRVNIIHKDIDWEKACEIEKSLIKEYGRKNLDTGNLVNMTDGGEGVVGVILSEETKQKMREAKKGNKHPMFGKPCSEETKQNMSKAQKGKTRSEETKQNMSKALKGRTFSKEAKQKMREAKKGEKNPNFGKTRSEETKQNISKAHRNKKGVKGYYFDKPSKKYISRIVVGVKRIKLGSFDTPGEAAEAYQKARLIYFV